MDETMERKQPPAVRDSAPDLMATATGHKAELTQIHLLSQVYGTFGGTEGASKEELERRAELTLLSMQEFEPRDALEGLVVAQMRVLHNAMMRCMGDAATAQTVELRDMHFRLATKLSSSFAKQAELLEKGRRKGQQKVTVEHVYVAPGGQAIVGTVESSARALSSEASAPRLVFAPDAEKEEITAIGTKRRGRKARNGKTK
jgi:hypothetical protein